MVGVKGEFIVRYKVAGNCFAVVRAEKFGGSVPQLPRVIGLDGVELVFEVRVALTQDAVEFGFVVDIVEIKGFTRGKDYDLLREVTVVWVVEAV